jgi:hypothetical protein
MKAAVRFFILAKLMSGSLTDFVFLRQALILHFFCNRHQQ